MKFGTRVDDFFDYLTQLIHLDRKHTTIGCAVTKLLHRCLEGAIDRLDAIAKKILESNHERKSEAALACLVNHFKQVDRAAVFLQWPCDYVAGRIYRKV